MTDRPARGPMSKAIEQIAQQHFGVPTLAVCGADRAGAASARKPLGDALSNRHSTLARLETNRVHGAILDHEPCLKVDRRGSDSHFASSLTTSSTAPFEGSSTPPRNLPSPSSTTSPGTGASLCCCLNL